MNKNQIVDKLFRIYQKIPTVSAKIRKYKEELKKKENGSLEGVTIITPNCLAGEIY